MTDTAIGQHTGLVQDSNAHGCCIVHQFVSRERPQRLQLWSALYPTGELDLDCLNTMRAYLTSLWINEWSSEDQQSPGTQQRMWKCEGLGLTGFLSYQRALSQSEHVEASTLKFICYLSQVCFCNQTPISSPERAKESWQSCILRSPKILWIVGLQGWVASASPIACGVCSSSSSQDTALWRWFGRVLWAYFSSHSLIGVWFYMKHNYGGGVDRFEKV